jgi:hypothetical protein
VLRKKFGPKRDYVMGMKKLHNKKLYDLDFSPNTGLFKMIYPVWLHNLASSQNTPNIHLRNSQFSTGVVG